MRRRDGTPNRSNRQPDWPYDPRPAHAASDEAVESELRGWELAVMLDLPDALRVFSDCLWRFAWPSTVEWVKKRFHTSWDQAEDAVSDAFADLWASFGRSHFPQVETTWAAFLAGASANKWLMARRKQHGTVNESALEDEDDYAASVDAEEYSSPIDALPAPSPTPADQLVLVELAEMIRKAVESLPAKQQGVTKATMAGLSHAETARQLGISPTSSRVHRSEASKQLRRDLRAYEDEFRGRRKKRA